MNFQLNFQNDEKECGYQNELNWTLGVVDQASGQRANQLPIAIRQYKYFDLIHSDYLIISVIDLRIRGFRPIPLCFGISRCFRLVILAERATTTKLGTHVSSIIPGHSIGVCTSRIDCIGPHLLALLESYHGNIFTQTGGQIPWRKVPRTDKDKEGSRR